jgi:hypothetical protein
MKTLNFNVRAFSILETIIGMIVSAIILGVIYVIFDILFIQMDNYKKINFVQNEVARLRFSLNKDVFESEELFLDNDKICFEKFNKETILYDLSENFLIRKHKTFVDTFHLSSASLKLDTLKNNKLEIVLQLVQIKASADSIQYDFKAYRTLLISNILQKE